MTTDDNLKNNKIENAKELEELSETIEKYKRSLYRVTAGLFIAYVILQLLRSSTYGWGVLSKFSPDRLGQLGDYIGGILNPLVAFFALMALFQTTQLQAKLTKQQIDDERQRAENQKDEAQKLKDIEINRQTHDDFVRLFDSYLRLVDSFDITVNEQGNGYSSNNTGVERNIYRGKALFNKLASIHFDAALNPMDAKLKVISFYIDSNRSSGSELATADQNLETEIKKGIRYLYPYYRVVFNLLKTESEKRKLNPICDDLVRKDVKFFRAQLSEGELIWIGLNLLYHEAGSNLSQYVAEFGLLKHLQSKAIKDDLLTKYNQPNFFGRKFAETYRGHVSQ